MKGSDLLVRCLENEGVRYIFGVPGEETLDILESLRTSSIPFVVTRHEQGAAFMANAYGRLTGKAGVCLSTLGPGATNLITGIADANLDRVPLVAITGQAALARIHKESHQYINIVEIFERITKWNTRIEKPEVIPEVVRKAFKVAETEKPGATHIELPEDVAQMEVHVCHTPLSTKRARRGSPDRESLYEAARLITSARHPFVLAGNGVVRKGASEELIRFVRELNIPVVSTFMGKGGFPENDGHFLGTIGWKLGDVHLAGLREADLCIAVGYDLVEYAPMVWNPNMDKKVVHIDFTPSEVDQYYSPAVEIVADIRESLELLRGILEQNRSYRYFSSERSSPYDVLDRFSKDVCFPMKPQRIIGDVRCVLGEEDILVSDVGAHKIWIARLYPALRPNTVLISNGFSAMGFALPTSITAKLLYPERKALAVCGDGGFLMSAQELETAVRLRIPIVVLVLVDSGYGLIRWKQKDMVGHSFGVEFGNPEFGQYARSFGAAGFQIECGDDLIPALTEAFSLNVPSVISVPVDYGEFCC